MEDNGMTVKLGTGETVIPERKIEIGRGIPESDQQLTDLLKKSIAHEKEKRKPFRPSWKTEYNSVFKLKEKLRVQRNLAIALTACYIFVDLLIKIFS